MKIIKLESENVKRLSAVSITPNGDVIEITGKNGEGKTSTLDSIWYALAGSNNIPAQPIRRGAERAVIRLDMGELIVTRTFKRKDGDEYTTSVKVESPDGASFGKPQAKLDALLGAITFDPLEFARMKPREQFDAVRGFVPGIDFEQIDDLNRGDAEKRAEAKRRMDDARAAAAAVIVNENLPDQEENEALIIDQLTAASSVNQTLQDEHARRAAFSRNIEKEINNQAARREAIEDLKQQIVEMEKQQAAAGLEIDRMMAERDAWPAVNQPVDSVALREQLNRARQTNEAIRKNQDAARRRRSLEKIANDNAATVDELNARIKARNQAKTEAISKAQMPVPGLGFGDGFITFNGLPFDQASSAEQLRTSIAIGMQNHSKLKVMLVRDGSLLDKDSFQLLCAMAAENGVQVWVESVFAHSEAAIVIEDGTVKAVAEDAA